MVGACASLTDILLRACPGVRILATSREPLGVSGEISWPIPPLSLPDTGRKQAPSELLRCEAVGLFVERAGPSRPVFPGYDYGAESLRSMLHLILKLGIATEKVVGIDTLADRLRTEVVASDGVIKPPDLVGMWAHKR